MYMFFYMKYLFQCKYLFKFKLSLHFLLYTFVYELKLNNPLWLELASIDNLKISWLLLVFWHIKYDTIFYDCTLHQQKRNSLPIKVTFLLVMCSRWENRKGLEWYWSVDGFQCSHISHSWTCNLTNMETKIWRVIGKKDAFL